MYYTVARIRLRGAFTPLYSRILKGITYVTVGLCDWIMRPRLEDERQPWRILCGGNVSQCVCRRWGRRFCQDRLTEKTEEVLVQTRTRVIAATLGRSGQPRNTRVIELNTVKKPQ